MAVIDDLRTYRGYSLIEMTAALGIMSFLVVSMLYIVSGGLGWHGKGMNLIETHQSARNGLDMIARDIKEGRKIVNVSGDTLTLINRDGKAVNYYVRSHTLYRSTNGVPTPVANSVYELILYEVIPEQYDISVISGTGSNTTKMYRRISK